MTDEDERKKLERARADYRLAMGEELAPPVRLPVTVKVAGIRSMTFEELMKVDHFEFTDDEAAKFLANLRADPDYQAADPSTAEPAELAEWVAPDVREEHRAIAGRTLARLRRAGIDIPPDLPLSDEKKREIAMNIFPGAERQPRLEPVFYPPLEEGPFVIEEVPMPRYVYETVPDERLNQLAHTADSDPEVDATIDGDTGLPVTAEKLLELAGGDGSVVVQLMAGLNDPRIPKVKLYRPAPVAPGQDFPGFEAMPEDGPPCVDCGLPESVHADAGGSRGLDGCKGYR